jgi:diguanylate cyclase (GGDEF)-like protein
MGSRVSSRWDDLTGLPGRDEFLRALDECIAEAEEAKGSVSLGLADIDMFRELNERHGSAAGDALLKALTAHLMEAAPEEAALYRCGGDEFMLLMPGVDKEDAFLLLERVRQAFEGERELTADGHDLREHQRGSGGVPRGRHHVAGPGKEGRRRNVQKQGGGP